MTEHESESGSVALIIALTFTIVLGMVVAGIVIGRNAMERRELLSAADAAALSGAYALQQRGNLGSLGSYTEPIARANTRLSVTPAVRLAPNHLPPSRWTTEARQIVQADLSSVFDSQQTWFQRLHAIQVRSCAQVNYVEFGERWPALVIALDASKSMGENILGTTGTSAYDVLRQVITAYTSNTFPVRNGLIVFRDIAPPEIGAITWEQAPSADFNVNNIAGIQSVFASVAPPCTDLQPCLPKTDPGTATAAALRRAGQLLQPVNTARNVLLITDGEPTVATQWGCAPRSQCCIDRARDQGDWVRGNNVRAALFTIEIRRTNYTPEATQLLERIAGQAGSPGNDTAMAFQVQSVLAIQSFMLSLVRSICAFGPLRPGPGPFSGPDAYHVRPSSAALADPATQFVPLRQRVWTYIREGSGQERGLRLVPNVDLSWTEQTFEYIIEPGSGEAYVVLSMAACNYLGADASRRVIVRWDEAQLTECP